MKRNLIMLGIAAGVLLLLTSTVGAGQDDPRVSMPKLPPMQLKQIYDRSELLRHDSGPVQLPRPVGGLPAASTNESPVSGPIAMAARTPDVNSVLTQARGGGSIYSEKQQDDREIRRLIRRLN